MAAPLVSINIPCYRQLPLARRAIESIRSQSFDDFEVTLLDDGASDEYRDYAASLGDPRVRYTRNPERLGAMHNMFAAIRAGRGRYTLAFHEDDLLGTNYLRAAIAILEAHPGCGFVACELHEFAAEPSAAELAHAWDGVSFDLIKTPADFLRGIFRGIEPMFGSIVYRRDALGGSSPAHDAFATLVDRPYLLSIMRTNQAAIIRAPLVWYRRHEESDGRHLAMSSDHVLRLFETYRAAFPTNWTRNDEALFYKYSRYWLPELHRLTPPARRPPRWRFLFEAWRRGLYRASSTTGLSQRFVKKLRSRQG
jgi:glycosyltransferase involved in cell wall biosynthesis